MEDLIKQFSEVGEDEEDSAFDALLLRLGRALDYDSGPGFLEDLNLDPSVDLELSNE